jgi:hypothetical protein
MDLTTIKQGMVAAFQAVRAAEVHEVVVIR